MGEPRGVVVGGVGTVELTCQGPNGEMGRGTLKSVGNSLYHSDITVFLQHEFQCNKPKSYTMYSFIFNLLPFGPCE